MKKARVGLIALLVVGMLTGCIGTLSESTPTSAGIEQQMSAYMDAYQEYCSFPYNGAILIAKDGNVLLREAYGIADLKTGRMNAVDSVFPIGSVTKSVTAAAILQLQEAGLLQVEDPISKYVEDHPRGNDITIHHLLTHTSGMNREGLFLGQSHVDLDTNIDFINRTPLRSDPGTEFSYSNAGYQMLAKIIEIASGQDYNTYVQENILSSLDMKHSYMGIDDTYSENQSIGYEITEGAPIRLHIYNFSAIMGGGNMYSTVGDMLKYAQALEGNDLLNESSMGKFNKAYADAEGSEYGYGWFVEKVHGSTRYSHGGCIGNGGYNSLMIRYPAEKISLIFLTNNADTTALFAVSGAMEAMLFEQAYLMPVAMERIELDERILSEYEGRYRIDGDVEIPFTVKKGKLMSIADDGNEYEVIPIGADRFYYEGHEAVQVIFKRENGAVTGVTFFNNANRFEGMRIDK